MESIEKEKTRQFEEIMRKERFELEKQQHERELKLKKTEMKLAQSKTGNGKITSREIETSK